MTDTTARANHLLARHDDITRRMIDGAITLEEYRRRQRDLLMTIETEPDAVRDEVVRLLSERADAVRGPERSRAMEAMLHVDEAEAQLEDEHDRRAWLDAEDERRGAH